MLRSLIFPVLLTPILSQLLSSTVDIKTLSELPLERLLQLKNNFAPKSEELICEDVSQRPQALPLQSKESYGVHEDSKGDKKGIQSIFQISVTTLAFLAFGGYLLCLIVQAIKGKQNYMDSSQVSSYILSNPVRPRPTRRRRPVRRRKPTRRRPTKYRKTTTKKPRYKREVWPEADPERMYDALVTLSEAYTKYHTVDYTWLNRTTLWN